MVTSAELNILTVKQLGTLAKELSVIGWHEMRKDELVRSLVSKSRSRQGGELIRQFFTSPKKSEKPGSKSKNGVRERGSKSSPKKSSIKPDTKAGRSPVANKNHPEPRSAVHSGHSRQGGDSSGMSRSMGESGMKQLAVRRDLKPLSGRAHEDRLVLLVRDPFWLHAFWELNSKTVERAKVALGHFWHTAAPVIRLYRLSSDGSTHPKRQFVRDVAIHGGVNNWYLDVFDPPSSFQAELGFLSREKKFYLVVSSNIVQTPQRQIVDDLDKLDGNWRGVADDLGRIYKLSGGNSGNHELKKVFEQQLKRPMSASLLSHRVAHQGGGSEKTRRNFQFEINADIVIHGKTDPSVQVTIRNEPIKINADGTFAVRFEIPEKRHVFPIEAEGSDGVEMQRVILTMERNTRILETLFQEHTEDD